MPRSRVEEPFVVEALDMLKFTRNADKVRTYISIYDPYAERRETPWIICGDIQISSRDNVNVWDIGARMGHGVTDFEHDSAYAFRFEAVGLQFDGQYFGRMQFTAWINPNDPETFYIPKTAANPLEAKDTAHCTEKECKAEAKKRKEVPHVIVDRFVPPSNHALYEKLRGKQIRIAFGAAWDPQEG